MGTCLQQPPAHGTRSAFNIRSVHDVLPNPLRPQKLEEGWDEARQHQHRKWQPRVFCAERPVYCKYHCTSTRVASQVPPTSLSSSRSCFGSRRLHLSICLATIHAGACCEQRPNAPSVAEAVAEYRETLRIKPNHVPAHINLGTLLVRQGKLQEAIGYYEIAIRIDPGNLPARECLKRTQEYVDQLR